MYERLGVVRGTSVISYCRTGVEASMTYFVLRYLGLDPTLYDGSFVEWSRDADTPVV
jgi:3-mercaptopyruvate sulfurtransferase SseA